MVRVRVRVRVMVRARVKVRMKGAAALRAPPSTPPTPLEYPYFPEPPPECPCGGPSLRSCMIRSEGLSEGHSEKYGEGLRQG